MAIETKRARTGSPLPRVAVLLGLGLCLAGFAPVTAQEPQDEAPAEDTAVVTVFEPSAADGPTYPIGSIEVRYLKENPLHPPLAELEALTFEVCSTPTGYTALKPDLERLSLTLATIRERPAENYHASACQIILETIRDHYVSGADLLGVFVAPDPRDINEVGDDLRDPGAIVLHVVITTGVVTELRTVASGNRIGENAEIKPEDRINNPVHAKIIRDSPIQPHQAGDDDEDGDRPYRNLLQKGELDRYLFHKSRHPGRRIDASVAAAMDVGGTALDYMVTENKPLSIYAQVSNTGTSQTNYWRERFGLFHTQLTNNDDIFSLDYATANFDEVHAVSGSYEAPFKNDRVRWRVSGFYADYSSSDLGFFDEEFDSETANIGAQVIWNVYQNRELFVDLIGGLRFMNVDVDNETFGIEGDENFLIFQFGSRLESSTEWYDLQAAALLEFQAGGVTDVDRDEIEALGRTDPDTDWVVLRASASYSVFLEPLLNRKAWEDPSTPKSSTLAHEMLFFVRGQYAFGQRLIPQEEGVAGGLYTVRGYPESAVAGDSMVIGTVEYRFHLPRALGIQPEPRRAFGQPFRAAPQYVYGSPDWDLVLKGFFDFGRVVNSDRFSFEENEWLVGIGVGAELLFKRNLNVRVDWGFALDPLDSPGVDYLANRVHIVATLLF